MQRLSPPTLPFQASYEMQLVDELSAGMARSLQDRRVMLLLSPSDAWTPPGVVNVLRILAGDRAQLLHESVRHDFVQSKRDVAAVVAAVAGEGCARL